MNILSTAAGSSQLRESVLGYDPSDVPAPSPAFCKGYLSAIKKIVRFYFCLLYVYAWSYTRNMTCKPPGLWQRTRSLSPPTRRHHSICRKNNTGNIMRTERGAPYSRNTGRDRAQNTGTAVAAGVTKAQAVVEQAIAIEGMAS